MRMLRFLTPLAALAAASSALAQDAPADWDVQRDPATQTLVAYVPMTTGLVIGVRCVKGDFAAIIAGLPEAGRNERIRTLRIGAPDHLHDSRWNVTTERSVAIADYPAPFARRLREGGPLSILVPGGGGEGRNLRHDIELPRSSAAIDEVLTACDRPLVDPRDALLPEIEEGGLPSGATWARRPRPVFPQSAYASGYAVVSCLATAEGRLEQCVLEAQHPADSAFGRVALRSTADARLSSPNEPEGQFTPRMVAFRFNFQR
jgi:hypothetical protein